MAQFPEISGWPGDYPSPEPKEKADLVYQDLCQLQKDPKLASSHSWLTMFAKNALDFKEMLDHVAKGHTFSSELKRIYNWFENAKEQNISLTEALDICKASEFKKLSILEEFFQDLTTKDKAGFVALLNLFTSYLSMK